MSAPTKRIAAALGAILIACDPLVLAQKIEVVAVSGDSPRDFSETLFEIDSAALSSSGDVYFEGTLRENGQFRKSGLFRGDGNRNEISAVILSGDPTPDRNGNIAAFGNTGYRGNRVGRVATLANLSGTLGGGNDNAALFLVDSSDRSLIEVARKGEVISDSDFGNLTRSPVTFSLNDRDQVVFSSTVLNTTANFFGSAVYLYEGGDEVEIFRTGLPAPGGEGTFLTLSPGTVPQLNQAGQVVLSAGVVPSSQGGPQAGIFLIENGETKTVALDNEEVPGGNGNLTGLILVTPMLGNGGDVAFLSRLQNTSGGSADNAAIYRFDGASLV